MTDPLAPANTLCTVSVVIPCFNAEKTLREAVASAQPQEGVTVQIIAVDDGSTDATAQIASEFSRPKIDARFNCAKSS